MVRLARRNPPPRLLPAPDPNHPEALWYWCYAHFGIKLAIHPTCLGHQSPYQIFHHKYQDSPANSIVHGPRGGGKSMMAGLGAHIRCRRDPGYRVKILGGSKMQSAQVADAMVDYVLQEPQGGVALGDAGPIRWPGREAIAYHNGSEMRILAASMRSVRGPHGPHLILDEVDEQDPELLEAAIGMVQGYARQGYRPMVEELSTWHNLGGPMGSRLDRAREAGQPVFTFCMFEVMEQCPESLSGRHLEKCPVCPIYEYCWADRFNDRRLAPRAKLASGHYTLETVLSKVATLSTRTFESDYLCLGPKAEGIWFGNYHDKLNVSEERAEYDPARKVYISIDYGVRTAAVFFQVASRIRDGRMDEEVHIFAEYYAEGKTAEDNALGIREVAAARCQGRLENLSMDSAADAREGAGTTGLKEYARAGLTHIKPWRKMDRRRKLNSLDLVNTFLRTADGARHLFIHPRCTGMRAALSSYRRAKHGNVWGDEPADPQHPHENYVDALAGQLDRLYPLGRVVPGQAGALKVAANRIG